MEVFETSSGFSSLFSIAFWLIVGGFVLVLGYHLVNLILNLTADQVTVEAKLISKDASTQQHGNSDGTRSSSTRHSFTFETEYGGRVILDVSYKKFRQYAVGDTGELVYQRKWLKEFRLNQL
ncbi:DUF2500 domain-containing protein [Vagococcus sp. DIV0080]|uniref:DUF2500 domain-containing protein n=1 Tax=Candidatus Vagococcus giribetii TaxID=2230876 RepID=A0ABS3HWA1_9ENTE|nr:DUF2500 family protein [Vagococcus sp. DIV0080]MBO0477620.1 DUF2500 domain-containing protein [Vagococcus sp. DIV0080]